MKKNIAIMIIGVLGAFSLKAQSPVSGATAPTGSEVRMANGMTYAEYAARVKAQQAKQATIDQAAIAALASTTAKRPTQIDAAAIQATVDKPVVPVKAPSEQEMRSKMKANQELIDKKTDELKKEFDMKTTTVSNAKPAVEAAKPVYDIPKPVPGTISAMGQEKHALTANTVDPSLKQSPANNKWVPEASATNMTTAVKATDVTPAKPVEKPVEVITKANTASATNTGSIINTMAQVAPAGTATPVENAAPAKLPEVKLNTGNSQVVIEEVKPSTNPAQPKKPVPPMQNAEKN